MGKLPCEDFLLLVLDVRLGLHGCSDDFEVGVDVLDDQVDDAVLFVEVC